MNQLTYPITQHLSSDVITDQFQNVNISTSYFLNMFKECSPYSIQHALTNNTFVDDLIDLIASIKIEPLELETTMKSPTFANHTLNMSHLQTSITNYNSKISNKSTTSVDVSLYLDQITQYEKLVNLYNKYKHLAQPYIMQAPPWNDTLVATLIAFIDPNPNPNHNPGINGHNNNQHQVEMDCLDNIYTYIRTINNKNIFTPDELNKINNIYKNTFNDTKLNATEFTKLYILLKYAFYLDNKENCETILEITNSTINRYTYILNINDQPLINIIDRFTSIKNQNGYRNQVIQQLFNNFNISNHTPNPNPNPAHIIPNPANFGIDNDWNILLTTPFVSINLFFMNEIVNTTAMCIYNIYLLLENVYKCIPLFNIIVKLINDKMKSATMLYFLITMHQLIANVFNQHVIQPNSILEYIRSYIDYRYSMHIPFSEPKLYDINMLCNFFFDISHDENLRDSLIRASVYIVSEYFPIDIGNSLREEISKFDNQQLDLLKNRINLNKNLLKTTYVNDLLLYIGKQTNDNFKNCFASLTSSDVRSNQFIDLYSLIYFKNDAIATILLESPNVEPGNPNKQLAQQAGVLTNPNPNNEHIGVSSPIVTGLVDISTRAHLTLSDDISYNSYNISYNSTEVGYSNKIYDDMIEMNYMYYDIDAEYLPQTYNENLFPRYKYLINKHHRSKTDVNSVENMFNFKYATAYSRIFLMNELSNQTYNIYTFDKQLNCFKSIHMKYIVDSRLKHVMYAITKMTKLDILEKLCKKNDQYLASDKDEKILIINNIIKELQ